MKFIQLLRKSDDKMIFATKYKNNFFWTKINSFRVFVFRNNCRNTFKLFYILLVFASISLLCGAERTERTTMCPNCGVRNITALRNYAMASIRDKILDALGYTNGTPESKLKDRRILLPFLAKFMDMYNVSDNQANSVQNTREIEEIPKIQRQEELITGEIIPPERRHQDTRHQHLPHNSTPFKFNLANFSSQDIKTAAVLLHVNNFSDCKQSVNVSIYQLYEGPSGTYKYKLIKTIENQPDNTSWIEIDITPDLQNFQLLSVNKGDTTMAVMLAYVNPTPSSNCPELSSDKAFFVLLKVQYNEKPKKRLKRTPVRLDCTDHQKYSECCRYPLEVDFDEMKWDFIITPRKYNAYYCLGDCPMGYSQLTAHTYLVQQMNTSVGPCCSAKKLNSISMLYFTHRGTILYSKVSGMVVESCGCT